MIVNIPITSFLQTNNRHLLAREYLFLECCQLDTPDLSGTARDKLRIDGFIGPHSKKNVTNLRIK